MQIHRKHQPPRLHLCACECWTGSRLSRLGYLNACVLTPPACTYFPQVLEVEQLRTITEAELQAFAQGVLGGSGGTRRKVLVAVIGSAEKKGVVEAELVAGVVSASDGQEDVAVTYGRGGKELAVNVVTDFAVFKRQAFVYPNVAALYHTNQA